MPAEDQSGEEFAEGVEEFIVNPSEISQELIKRVKKLERKYNQLLKPKNPIEKLINNTRLRIWYLQKPREFYSFINSYEKPHVESRSLLINIKTLFREFEQFYERIAINNLLLAYAYLIEGKPTSAQLLTKAEEKLDHLEKLAQGAITPEQFKHKFGHYAINSFELSSRRFNEYSSGELLALAKPLRGFKFKRKPRLAPKVLAGKDKFSVYVALREELRYQNLFIIQALRAELLSFAERLKKARRIKKKDEIFNFSYDQLMEMKI